LSSCKWESEKERGGGGGYDGSVEVITLVICRERTVGERGGKTTGDQVEMGRGRVRKGDGRREDK